MDLSKRTDADSNRYMIVAVVVKVSEITVVLKEVILTISLMIRWIRSIPKEPHDNSGKIRLVEQRLDFQQEFSKQIMQKMGKIQHEQMYSLDQQS